MAMPLKCRGSRIACAQQRLDMMSSLSDPPHATGNPMKPAMTVVECVDIVAIDGVAECGATGVT